MEDGKRFTVFGPESDVQHKDDSAICRGRPQLREARCACEMRTNPVQMARGKGRDTMFEHLVQPMTEFVREHRAWAAPIVGILAFAESLAFVSLLVPAWGALVAIGTMISVGGLDFWPILFAGALGAALGDWLSFWIGDKLKHRVFHMWPLSKYPDMLPRAEAFVAKWGVPGIFLARFSGPLRAAVPLAAGIFEMPYWRFQFANFTSAFVWAAVLLLFGDVIAKSFTWLSRFF
jgi:membrane protein DedA with SNARE-associated domain